MAANSLKRQIDALQHPGFLVAIVKDLLDPLRFQHPGHC
jgi:hypothetical protein